MYDNMYSTKYNDLLKNKTSALSELDKQSAENNENFYNQRNQAAYENANSKRSIRDFMAKNNLLQSGESVDALLRNSTDYANSIGTINSNETKAKNEILNNRNRINSEFNGNVTAAKSDIESQKIQAILEYQQQQEQLALQKQQLELQKQQLAASRASSSRSSSSSSNSTSYSKPSKTDARSEIQTALKKGQWASVKNMLDSGAIRDTYGTTFEKEVQALYNSMGGVSFNISHNPKRYVNQSTKY